MVLWMKFTKYIKHKMNKWNEWKCYKLFKNVYFYDEMCKIKYALFYCKLYKTNLSSVWINLSCISKNVYLVFKYKSPP